MPRLFRPPADVAREVRGVEGPFGPIADPAEVAEFERWLDACEESLARDAGLLVCVQCGRGGRVIDGLCGCCWDRFRDELEAEPEAPDGFDPDCPAPY